MEQYFQSPEEDDVDESGILQVLHKVELKEADSEYLQARTANIMEKIPEIDEKLNQAAAGWKTKRMGKVELTILRLALYEMLHDDAIPEKVSINEAVELAKKFGGNDSPSFVNGILAKFVVKGARLPEMPGCRRCQGAGRKQGLRGDSGAPGNLCFPGNSGE